MTLRDREVKWPFAPARVVAITAIALAMLALLWPHLDYVPLWDGRVYANCVLDAAYGGFTMEALRCGGHPSQAWAFVMALPQLFNPGSATLLTLTSAALAIGAAIGFRVVLARTVPDPARAVELDLVTAAAALHPVVLSTLLQPNVDFGVYAFFFVALAGLLSPGRAGTAVAILGGTGMAFSKETGVAAYGLATATIVIAQELRAGGDRIAAVRRIVVRGTVLAAPVALFLVHVVAWNATHRSSAIWKHGWQQSTTDGFQFFDLSDPIFLSYAAGLFVLGFGWTVWVPVVIDTATGIARAFRRRAARVVEGADGTNVVALTVLTALLTYLLTSFRTWSNLRYFALCYPLFILVAYLGVSRLGWSGGVRRAVIAAWIGLFITADLWSNDPLSRAAYGVFDTGAGTMYRMTSITGEFDGPGRDQLVYNLQFPGYHHVQNALFDRLQPTDSTVIGTPRTVRWNIWSQLDPATRHRTLRRADVFAPVYADEADIAARQARDAWFVEFSNRPEKDRALDGLLGSYRIVDSVTVVTSGQRLTARRIVRR